MSMPNIQLYKSHFRDIDFEDSEKRTLKFGVRPMSYNDGLLDPYVAGVIESPLKQTGYQNLMSIVKDSLPPLLNELKRRF